MEILSMEVLYVASCDPGARCYQILKIRADPEPDISAAHV